MKYNCVVCVCCIIVNFGTLRTMFSQNYGGVCNGFEFRDYFRIKKHVVEDDVLFTNHLAGTRTIKETK